MSRAIAMIYPVFLFGCCGSCWYRYGGGGGIISSEKVYGEKGRDDPSRRGFTKVAELSSCMFGERLFANMLELDG
jgi:hypothetical protein